MSQYDPCRIADFSQLSALLFFILLYAAVKFWYSPRLWSSRDLYLNVI